MSIRILHVHVHPHALSATVASPNDDDPRRQRTRIGDGKETGLAAQKETGHRVRGYGTRNTGKGTGLRGSLALNLILISPEWLSLFPCPFVVRLLSSLFLFFTPALLAVFLFLYFLLSTNAANKCKATTYDFLT